MRHFGNVEGHTVYPIFGFLDYSYGLHHLGELHSLCAWGFREVMSLSSSFHWTGMRKHPTSFIPLCDLNNSIARSYLNCCHSALLLKIGFPFNRRFLSHL